MKRKPFRGVGLGFMLDTNSINAKKGDANITRIQEWGNKRIISVILASDTVEELQRYRAGDREAANYVRVEPDAARSTPPENIRQALFPKGYSDDPKKRTNEEIDVWIIASAKKHGHTLITIDGAILEHAKELSTLGVRVSTPAEAAQEVANKIKVRDDVDCQMYEEFGEELPDWHGKD